MTEPNAAPGANPRSVSDSSPSSASRGFRPQIRRHLRALGRLLLLGWAATMVWVGFVGLNRELKQDESYVVWLDQFGWAHFLKYIRFEPSAPLYHYLMRVWFDLGGVSESWVRLPSSLFWLASFPIIWVLGGYVLRRSERVAVFVLILACRTLGADAIFGRYFEMMYFEMCVVLFSFIGLYTRRMPRRLAMILLAVGNFAGLMTHYYFAFCLMAQGLAFLVFFGWRQLGAFLITAVMPTLLFAIVWIPTFRAQLASGRFAEKYLLPEFATLIQDTYFGRRWLIVGPAMLVLLFVSHRRARWRLGGVGRLRQELGQTWGDQRVRIFGLFWAVLVFFPFLTAIVLGKRFLKPEPFVVLATLPLMCAISVAFSRTQRSLRLVAGCLVVGLIAVSDGRYRWQVINNPFPATDSRVAVNKLMAKAQPQDQIICIDYYYTIVDYYLRKDHAATPMNLIGFPKDLENHPGYASHVDLDDRRTLNKMADEYVAGVVQAAKEQPGSHVWLIDSDWQPEFTSALMVRLSQAMTLSEQIDVPGGEGYKTIYGFVARSSPSRG